MKKTTKSILTFAAVLAVGTGVFFGIRGDLGKWIKQLNCSHTWDEGVVTLEATCSHKGEMTFTCTECEDTKTKEIAMTPHIEEYVAEVPPTCTEDGLTDGVACYECGVTIVGQERIPAHGHEEVPAEEVPATCLSAGKTSGTKCKHCGEILSGCEVIPSTGHSVIEVEAYEATCDKDGFTGGAICEHCGKIYTGESIPATGHDWVEKLSVPDVYTTYECSVCGEEKTEWENHELNCQKGHHVVDTSTGKCKYCGTTVVSPY